jgi:hypothetical protein
VVLPIVVIIAYFLRENHVELCIGVLAEPTSVIAQRHRGISKKKNLQYQSQNLPAPDALSLTFLLK